MSRSIQLIEDEPGLVLTLKDRLTREGYEVDAAQDGNLVLASAMRGQADLIILDLMLPGRSGFLVLEKIKSKKPRNAKPFVIMITGNQGGRHKMYAETLGVSEYFNKPVKMDKLIAAAEKLLAPAPV